MLKSFAHKVSAWRNYLHSVRELSELTDRELADIGIVRQEIEIVARRAAGL